MSRIDPSVLSENDPQLAEALAKATTSAEIRAALEDQMKRQGAKAGYDPAYLDTTEMRVHESLLPTFKKIEIIGGKSYEFEGTSQEDLNHKIVLAYRGLATTNSGSEVSRDAQGRFAAQPVAQNPVERVELELQFKRGDISVSDYLHRSGALDDYAREKWGIDVDAVAASHQVKTAQDATEVFLQSHPEWPGGLENLRRMTTVLQENMEVLGLDKGELTPQILERAYEHMREHNLLVANEEIVAANERAIRDAKTPEELRAAAAASQGRSGSSLWG